MDKAKIISIIHIRGIAMDVGEVNLKVVHDYL